jgi:hypothetical protein
MSAETRTTGPDAQVDADAEAVLRHVFHGEPLAPEVSRRVHERAEWVYNGYTTTKEAHGED